jgi:glycosyltransferase involved in cell wall biosynthesis
MARHLAGLGCDVTFLSGIPFFGRAAAPVASNGMKLRAYAIRSPYFGDLKWDSVPAGWRVMQLDYSLFQRRALSWLLARRREFDVVQACELPRLVAGWKAARTGVPVVMRLTSPIYHDPVGGITAADRLIASGTTIGKIRAEVRPDCANIPNGVDTDLFRPHESTFRRERGIAADEIVVLYVARFAGVKNHPMLVRAFARMMREAPRARLVLVGSGPNREATEALCAEQGIGDRVIFTGETSFAGTADIYAAADIKVIASDYESFSFTALEAMATGLPLVVTDTQWVPRLIGISEGGCVVPKNDDEAMGRALTELARNPALRARLGARNREVAVREYGWDASAGKLLHLYRELIQQAAHLTPDT